MYEEPPSFISLRLTGLTVGVWADGEDVGVKVESDGREDLEDGKSDPV